MLPVLFSIGPFTLYTYSIFLFISLILAMFVIWKRGRDAHFDEEELVRFGLYLLLWGLVGSRITYLIMHLPLFQTNLVDMVNIIAKPGFDLNGGLVAMIMAYIYKAKKLKWDIWLGADVMVVGFMLWRAIMSLAHFFNGSGAGSPTQLFIGVSFSGMYERRLPVQLLELLLYGLIFFLLWRVESRYRTFGWYKGSKSEANSGFITGSAFLLMGLVMLFAELFKPDRILIANLVRVEIVVGLILMISGLIIFHTRSGGGLGGVMQALLSDWGITGSLVEKWKKKRARQDNSKLTLGRDIFE